MENPHIKLLGRKVTVTTTDGRTITGFLKDAAVQNRIVVGDEMHQDWGQENDSVLMTSEIASIEQG